MDQRYHYVGLEHSIEVSEHLLGATMVNIQNTIYIDSKRELSHAELASAWQSRSSEALPFYDKKWVQLTAAEHQVLLEAKKKGEEEPFLDYVFANPSRIIFSESQINSRHKYIDLVQEELEKSKKNKK